MTVGEKYKEIKERLARTGEAHAEASVILAHVLRCDLGGVHLRFLDECKNEAEIDDIIVKRLTGMPLAYAMGSKNFFGYDFYVDGSVLIPRFDSECVVLHALGLAKERGYESVLDLCCGSGCLGITLYMEGGAGRVVFSDISPDALAVARLNAKNIAPDAPFSFVCGDLFAEVRGTFDLIVCNPPYVSPEEYARLEPQVKDFEPKSALYADSNGYGYYMRIAKEAMSRLNPGGALVLETGSGQHGDIKQLLNSAGFDNIFCGCDLQGRPRFISATKNGGAKGKL